MDRHWGVYVEAAAGLLPAIAKDKGGVASTRTTVGGDVINLPEGGAPPVSPGLDNCRTLVDPRARIDHRRAKDLGDIDLERHRKEWGAGHHELPARPAAAGPVRTP